MRIERNNSLDALKALSIAFVFFWLVKHYQVAINTGIFRTPLSKIFVIKGFFVVFFTVLSIYLFRLTRLKQFVT